MERIIQRGTDHRYIIKQLGQDRYEVTLQEYSSINNIWYAISKDIYDKSGLSMLGISI